MIRNQPFSLILNYHAETDRKGKNRISFHASFQEPFYLSPNQWEVGLVKTLVPHTRLLPLPRLRFEIKHTLENGMRYGGDIISNYQFDLPAQQAYTIYEHVIEWNKLIRNVLEANETENSPSAYTLTLEYTNNKITIPHLKSGWQNGHESSQVRFLDVEEWRKLGFLNVFNSDDYHDTPCEAASTFRTRNLSTTLLLTAPNLIESQLFGDTIKPVLELIPYNFDRTNSIVEFSFPIPSYKRLTGGYISEIDLELEDLDEKIISIPSATFQFVLLFRPCQSTIKML